MQFAYEITDLDKLVEQNSCNKPNVVIMSKKISFDQCNLPLRPQKWSKQVGQKSYKLVCKGYKVVRESDWKEFIWPVQFAHEATKVV